MSALTGKLREYVRSVPTLVKGLILLPFAAFLFNWFAPGIWEGAREQFFGSSPLEVLVGDHQDEIGDGWAIALPASLPSDGRPAPGSDDLLVRTWLKDNGGIDVPSSHLQMAVRGTGRSAVLISGMEARVLSESAIVNNTLVQFPSAGANDAIRIYFDLDSKSPIALRSVEDGEPYFSDSYITVNPGEIVVFNIEATAREATYEWVIELQLQYDGEQRSVTVKPERGDAFVTTAWSPSYRARFDWAWYQPSGGEFLEVDEGGLPLDD